MWISVVAVLYSLPSTLQIPVFSLALSLWVMLLTWMSERRNESPAETFGSDPVPTGTQLPPDRNGDRQQTDRDWDRRHG